MFESKAKAGKIEEVMTAIVAEGIVENYSCTPTDAHIQEIAQSAEPALATKGKNCRSKRWDSESKIMDLHSGINFLLEDN